MTEQDWLEFDDPDELLEFLRGRASERKLRLFACACARRIWHLITDRWSRQAVKVAEKFADGLVDEAKLKYAWGDARRSFQQVSRPNHGASPPGFIAIGDPAEPDAWMAAVRSALVSASHLAGERAPHEAANERWLTAYVAERGLLCPLLRDVFGNPFRPATVANSCRTPPAVALAQGMYEDRCFDDMPLLADALEEAGCTETAILNHCREPGPHARGCWVIDLLLDKS